MTYEPLEWIMLQDIINLCHTEDRIIFKCDHDNIIKCMQFPTFS
jgi:hypothetical protein